MTFDELLSEWTRAKSEADLAHQAADAALRDYHRQPGPRGEDRLASALRARDAAHARMQRIIDCVFGTHGADDCEMCACAQGARAGGATFG